MIIPTINLLHVMFEELGENPDDFYVQLDAYIREQGEVNPYSYELFTFNIVSPKRLMKFSEIEVGRGYLITNDYNIQK